jgi:hypothetical protein
MAGLLSTVLLVLLSAFLFGVVAGMVIWYRRY